MHKNFCSHKVYSSIFIFSLTLLFHTLALTYKGGYLVNFYQIVPSILPSKTRKVNKVTKPSTTLDNYVQSLIKVAQNEI